MSFSISTPSDITDEFEDFRHPEVHGNLVRPPGMMVERVELSFLPKISLNESVRTPSKRTTIGLLQLRAKRLNGIISMPADALGPPLNTLEAGRLRHVIINAGKIRHRRAVVRGARTSDVPRWPGSNIPLISRRTPNRTNVRGFKHVRPRYRAVSSCCVATKSSLEFAVRIVDRGHNETDGWGD